MDQDFQNIEMEKIDIDNGSDPECRSSAPHKEETKTTPTTKEEEKQKPTKAKKSFLSTYIVKFHSILRSLLH
jgi:hypothetical protein